MPPGRRPRDLTLQRFGKLTVVCRAPNYVPFAGRQAVRWQCVCDCGRSIVVRADNLTRRRAGAAGHTTSCGCVRAANLCMLNDAKRLRAAG